MDQIAEINACMDFRTGEAVSEAVKRLESGGYSGSAIAVFRTAGPMVYSMGLERRLAEHPEMKLLVIQPHTDCGMAKVCHAILSGAKVPIGADSMADVSILAVALKDKMVSAGRSEKEVASCTLQDVEAAMPSVLREMAEKIAKSAGRSDLVIEVEQVDHNRLGLNGKHTDNVIVVIGRTERSEAELRKAAGLGSAYMVQVSERQSATTSVELAASVMNKKNFVVIPGSADMIDQAELYSRAIRNTAGPNATVSFVRNGKAKVR